MASATVEPSDPTIVLPASQSQHEVEVVSDDGVALEISIDEPTESSQSQRGAEVASDSRVAHASSSQSTSRLDTADVGNDPSEPTVNLTSTAAGISPQPLVKETSTGVIELEGPTKPGALGWLVTRVLPIIALGGICAWAWSEISSITEGPDRVRPVAEMIKTEPGGSTGPEAAEIDFDVYNEDELYGGLGRAILASNVERLDLETNEVGEVPLSRLFRRRAITVVNLWATYCAPCAKEFSLFSSVFHGGQKESGWGPEVRFMTMLINDAETPLQKALKDFSDKLPEHVDDFVAARSFNNLTELLQERKLLQQQVNLPVTFVLDCRRQVKWIHLKALDDTSTLELREKISDLRSELKTEKCKVKKKPPVKVKKKSVVAKPDSDGTTSGGTASGETQPPTPVDTKQGPKFRCGDKRCDAELGENIKNCPRDCAAGTAIFE